MSVTTVIRKPAPGLLDGLGSMSVQSVGLAVVWLTMASSAFVLMEPAPVDVLSIGLIFLLPLLGLTQVRMPIVLAGIGWIIVASAGFVAANFASDISAANTHVAVTLYLSLFGVTLAAFILKDPERHGRIIFSGYTAAAIVAAILGLVGYFDLVPGAHELLTKYSRAKATFKDPNVFGPFLILPIVNLVTLVPVQTGWRRMASGVGICVLCFALLLSFSRAAGAALVLSLLLCGYLHFIKAGTHRSRFKLASLSVGAALASVLLIVVALQFNEVADLARERASITHMYDVGPQGRFGGQVKGLGLLLEHPLGLGAGEFVSRYHHEEPHNVYISMMMNSGWVGGIIYLLLVGCTAAYGIRTLIQADRSERLLIVVTISFLAHVAIGLLIDSDHWRHFFLLFGLLWGFALASNARRRDSVKTVIAPTERRLPLIRGALPATEPYRRRRALEVFSRW